MSVNPVRDVVDHIAREFKMTSANCQILTKEVNALHNYITDSQNKKPMRRLTIAFGLTQPLQPYTNGFKDKSRDIIDMFNFVRDHYDDMKRRYIYALDQLADMKMKFNRMVEEDLDKQAREKPLGETWEDFCSEPIKCRHKEAACQTNEKRDEFGHAEKDIDLNAADLAEMKMAVQALLAENKEKDKLNSLLQAENRNLLAQIHRFDEFYKEFQSAQDKILELSPRSRDNLKKHK